MRNRAIAIAAASVFAASAAAAPAQAGDAVAHMQNVDGEHVGTVTLTEVPNGTMLHARLAFLPAGAHAFHVHAVGKCNPPFKSAGGHYNPNNSNHGIMDDDGMHVGDMPNIHVPSSGVLEVEVLNENLDLNESLFDDDGAAIVIHEGPDDYKTDPAGAAGSRIACGVIEEN